MLQSALESLEEIRTGKEGGYRDRRSAGPGGGGYNFGSSPTRAPRSVDSGRMMDQSSPNHSYNVHQIGMSTSSSVTGTISNPYLSPPTDPSWRRTNSDTALHHGSMLQGEILNSGILPSMRHRGMLLQVLFSTSFSFTFLSFSKRSKFDQLPRWQSRRIIGHEHESNCRWSTEIVL